jgi:hypothetical protein
MGLSAGSACAQWVGVQSLVMQYGPVRRIWLHALGHSVRPASNKIQILSHMCQQALAMYRSALGHVSLWPWLCVSMCTWPCIPMHAAMEKHAEFCYALWPAHRVWLCAMGQWAEFGY